MSTTIVFEPGHRGRDGAMYVAEELAASMAARLMPAAGASIGGRRRARRLAAIAEREAAALLVVPVEDPSPMVASLVGRPTAEIVRAAPCPVVLVPPALADAKPPLLVGDHVLWAVADHRDGGCAPVAARMAQGLDLPVTVAHVLPGGSDALSLDELHSGGRLVGWFVDGLLRTLAEHDPWLQDRSTARLSSGDPGRELRRLGDEEGAALAVVGCRGRGSLRAAALGSVSAHLAHHGATPVVVCPPGASHAWDGGLTGHAAA